MKSVLLLINMCLASWGISQTVTFNGTGGMLIPPGAPAQTAGITQSPCTVSGVGIIGGCVSIANVSIDLTHTWVGDIGILLIGPGGLFIDLSTGNGGAGDNYTNTVFSDDAGQFITAGSPPFSGNFRPEGRANTLSNPYSNGPPLGTYTFANTFNGTNADGVWILYINDYVAADVGVINSWSITFNLGGTPPVADAGPDVTICTGQSTTLIASGGTTYEWSNSATTESTTVSPLATTTYTVTVSAGSCGTDTDEVVVSVGPQPTVAFSIPNPQLCVNNCAIVTVTFTGAPPFVLTYKITDNAGSETVLTQFFPTVTGSITVCAPSGTALGNYTVEATSLEDDQCICN